MRTRSATAQRSVWLAWLFIGSFALTIASFVSATLVSAHRAKGIHAAAESIATNALPSVACYSRTRTDLRQLELLLERLTGASVPDHIKTTPEAVRETRDALTRNWNKCLALPKYPEEEAAQQRIDEQANALSQSIDTILRALEAHDTNGAIHALFAEAEPRIDLLDDEIVATIDLNVRQSAMRGAEITALRDASQKTLTFLVVLSSALAATAAVIMVRVLIRFTSLMESRVTDMEQFAARIAHDIRSPLSAVGIALELTKRDPAMGLERGVIDRATRTVQRIGQLVDGLLVFARAGASSPEGSEADPGKAVEGVIDEMRPLADENAIELIAEPPLSSARVACSAGVLMSVLSNLVGNAIKHMGSSPVRRVTVRARDAVDCVRLEVQDTGPGIPADLGPRIFDPYVRASASTTPGLGLGLATVRRLVVSHGGSVGVLANKPVGTTFWVELPLAAAEQHQRPRRHGWWPLASRRVRA